MPQMRQPWLKSDTLRQGSAGTRPNISSPVLHEREFQTPTSSCFPYLPGDSRLLENGELQDQGGKSEEHVWETGKAYWLPANPPDTMHADVNAGGKPIEGMCCNFRGCWLVT